LFNTHELDDPQSALLFFMVSTAVFAVPAWLSVTKTRYFLSCIESKSGVFGYRIISLGADLMLSAVLGLFVLALMEYTQDALETIRYGVPLPSFASLVGDSITGLLGSDGGLTPFGYGRS
jgi:hypothetical protein